MTNERIIKLGMPLQIDSERKSCGETSIISLRIVERKIGMPYEGICVCFVIIIKNYFNKKFSQVY